jgi:hypothetical protein
MSRVFVSCSVRDRAVGAELGSLVRSLGHESADDQDESQGTAWWNEVVGRIDASDVFVAVASPAYAEAQSCRLAARHAAATGLPVVRVELDDKAVPGCHPVVEAAVGVPFAPEDPEAVVRLAYALTGAPADVPEASATSAPPPADPKPPPEDPQGPSEPDRTTSGFSALEVGSAVVMTLIAAGLLFAGLSMPGGSEPSRKATPQVPEVTGSATTEPAASGAPRPSTAVSTTDPAVAALLARVEAVDSPLLPVSSCQAGAEAVTCSNPAPNIRSVVLTPYATPDELYAAYTAQVERVSGEPMEENTGNCSNSESEGEIGWDLDMGHTLDFSVAEQQTGGLDPASESAGRVFCTDSQKVMTLVWTQDPGLLVTATGQPSELVVTWWSDEHLQLACPSDDVGSGCA